MPDTPTGYQLFWKRVARHIGLSEAAKAVGVRASALSAFEKGNEHPLTPEQIVALNEYLEAIPVPEPEIPELIDDDEPTAAKSDD